MSLDAITAQVPAPPVLGAERAQSGTIAALSEALAKAQAEIKNAAKDSANPHYGSRYSDLASVWDACREPLTKFGLAVVQQPVGDGDRVGVATTLAHSSGQYMTSVMYTTPERKGPQAAGSAITYLRRQALAAVAGVAPADADDDGEAATDREPPARAPVMRQAMRPANDNASARRPGTPPGGAGQPAASPVEKPTMKAMRRYHALRDELGISADEARARVCNFLGRTVESMNDLSAPELGRLLDAMEAQKNATA